MSSSSSDSEDSGPGGESAPPRNVKQSEPADQKYNNECQMLVSMGFPDTVANMHALQASRGDVNAAVAALTDTGNSRRSGRERKTITRYEPPVRIMSFVLVYCARLYIPIPVTL